MAENNHQRTIALRAPRGLVFDRDGRVLVEHRHSYSIYIVREHTKDLTGTIQALAQVLGLDEGSVRAIVDRHRREPTYRPITIVPDASLAQVAAVVARRLDLPDVCVERVPTRRYPETMGAHLFGYVGEVRRPVADSDDTLKQRHHRQSGIEKSTTLSDGRRRRAARRREASDARSAFRGTPANEESDNSDRYRRPKSIEDAFIPSTWEPPWLLDLSGCPGFAAVPHTARTFAAVSIFRRGPR
jgi:hypothetical protein